MKKPKENWEEEFDLEWQTAFNNDFLIRDWDSIGRDLKRFISTLLQQERKRIIEEVKDHLTSDGGGLDSLYKYLGFKFSTNDEKESNP